MLVIANIFQLYNGYKITNSHRTHVSKLIMADINHLHDNNLVEYYNSASSEPRKHVNEILDSDILFSFNSFSITHELQIVTYIPKLNFYFILEEDFLIVIIINQLIPNSIIMIIIFTIFFIIYEVKSQKRNLIHFLSTSNSLREKNMQILTENIHHELNTPLAIINGNIRKLEVQFKDKEEQIDFDFEQIYISADQIQTVLSRMSNFKELKYSNGNKSLDDIIKYSSNSMGVYKRSNFNINIADGFGHYKLPSYSLKNADLLNIVSNHFRNSLEAGASKIDVHIKYHEQTKVAHLYIIDNGSGLRDPITGLPLSKNNYNDIFKPYYSSKDANGESCVKNSSKFDMLIRISSIFKSPKHKDIARGVGLYLNKELLKDKGGDLILKETSPKGTVFEIVFPVIYKIK